MIINETVILSQDHKQIGIDNITKKLGKTLNETNQNSKKKIHLKEIKGSSTVEI